MAGNLQNLPQPGILTELLSILFPLRCAHCGRAGNWLCDECAEQLRPIGPAICRRCGRPLPASMPDCPECRGRELQFDRARAAFCFDGPARSLVHRLKYSGQRRLASFMADLSLEAMADLTENCERVNLTSVPLHSSKLVSRGYNQAG
ncbi:MAG: ComF family protein, partial [Thermoleophilia bacterium]|nr:ComF family protein [Thermoleophilia bacterium]